jgi:pilus assembly protein CpaD
MMKQLYPALALIALSACTSNWDMQGTDPKDYYAEHPIKNTLETHTHSQLVHFATKENKLSGYEAQKLQDGLHGVSLAAVESVEVQMSDADMKNASRKQSIRRLLHNLGYARDNYSFVPSAAMARDDMQLNIVYATVVSPECPDWRTSPITTYSNTTQGNFRCATETNLGLMVADPHDLVRGTGDVRMDSQRADQVVNDYRAGKDFSAKPAAADSSSSSGSDSVTAPAGGQ